MAITSILRIDQDGKPLFLYGYDAISHECNITSVAEWTDQSLLGIELCVLVPASWVYHSQTHVASKNSELLAKSIPYAVEEELSNDVDDNYFAFKLNDDGSQQVIAIEKKHLDQLNEHIENLALNVTAIYSEVNWLPATDTDVSIWQDSDSTLLKFGENQAMRVVNSQVEQLLPVFGEGKKQIRCQQSNEFESTDFKVIKDLTETACCHFLMGHDPINLYLNEIKVKQTERDSDTWKKFKYALGFLLVSWVFIQAYQWSSLNRSIATIKQQQKDLLAQNYPNAAPAELVDPFAAMQSRMKLNDGQSIQAQSMLITTLDYLGQTQQQQPAVKLIGLRLVEQKMEIQIVAPNMTVINDFHQLLQSNASKFTVQIGVNELGDDNTFKSILTMVPR